MYPCDRNHRFQEQALYLVLDEQAHHLCANTVAELQPFVDRLEERMRVLGYPYRDIFAVRLALHEAANNAFRHGNRGDRAKHVWVRHRVTATEVHIEVEDQGRGFDPNQVPDPLVRENLLRPGGRGLFLMRMYMTWVSYNREGNRVTLARRRSQA